MRAVILEQYNEPLVVDDVEPLPLGSHDVLVEIGASGVCHSDLSATRGQYPFVLPIVLGHEGAGVVTEVGSDVTMLKVDRLVGFVLWTVLSVCARSGSPV
jgi:S-(hydroxymethyl)glutathione dehydrogenase/alcohol dehydrogenase